MPPLTTLPEKTDESIGRVKVDSGEAPNLDNYVPAEEYERLKQAIIDIAAEVGVHAGDVGSLNARLSGESNPAQHTADASTVGLWQLNGSLAATVGSNLSVSTGNELYAPGPKTDGECFAGDDETRLAQAHVANLLILGALTIEVLVRVRARRDAGDDYAEILTFAGPGETSVDNIAYSLRIEEPSCRLVWLQEHTGGSDVLWRTRINLPVGVWTHIAATRASDGRTMLIYINGILRDSTTLANAPTGGGSSFLNVAGFPTVTDQFFCGDISSLKINNTVRSAADIRADARATLPFYLRPPAA